ncbi:MAG: hypothetical protein ACTSP9_15620 [Promethearchaeota archaeon]
MAVVNEKKLVDNETKLIDLISQTKQLNLTPEDIKCIDKPELLFEYLKDDSNNIQFEYAIKFYAYGFGLDGFDSYEGIMNTTKIQELDYKIIWYPEWRVLKKKEYIENLF